MSEPTEVEIRCGRCLPAMGASAPVLAFVRPQQRRNYAADSRINAATRTSGAQIKRAKSTSPYAADANVAWPRPMRKTLPPKARGGAGVELKCRCCHWSPRPSRRRQYELAEQALERGERIAYLFPD